MLFRREFIEDVSVEGEFFDEEFFAFREDADLAWRAQIMGWKYLYTPAAVAWHVRRVTPERASKLPLLVNWHSVKNRWLMRAKNASGWLCWRLLVPVYGATVAAGYALVRDRRLLSACLYLVARCGTACGASGQDSSAPQSLGPRLLWWFSNTPRAIDSRWNRDVLAAIPPHR